VASYGDWWFYRNHDDETLVHQALLGAKMLGGAEFETEPRV